MDLIFCAAEGVGVGALVAVAWAVALGTGVNVCDGCAVGTASRVTVGGMLGCRSVAVGWLVAGAGDCCPATQPAASPAPAVNRYLKNVRRDTARRAW